MNKATEKRLNDIIEANVSSPYINPNDIPGIGLYMDQVTTFMNSFLNDSKRFEDDKILTKTMINNYTKNNLLPPSDKKKYSREHVLLLIFIYYYKNMLSITDIQQLLDPIIDNIYDRKDKNMSLQKMYSKMTNLQCNQNDRIKADIKTALAEANSAFADSDSTNKDLITMFSFVTMLSNDIYIKKKLIESVIDDYFVKEAAKSKLKNAKPKKQK